MSRTVDLSPVRRQTSLSLRERLGLVAAAVRGTTVGPFSLKDPAAHEEYRRYSALSDAGIYVTEEEAFTYSAVWDAVLQISSDTAKVPLVLFKRDGNQRAPYVESPVYRLLHDEPNAEQNAMVFRRTITAHALTAGNGYAEIERDAYNRPAALHLLTPNRVRPVRNRATKALEYEVDHGKTFLQPRNVLHIQGLSFDGLEGYDVIDKARRAIGIAIANEKFAARFFGNGMTFGGLLTTDEPLDDKEERREIREEIEKSHQGADKAHRLLVLGGGWSFTRFGVDPNKAQMKETREMQAIAVANFFNIPLHKIKSLERATNNNIEHQDLEYYKGCLLTWYTLWEQEANRKMVSRLEYRRQYFKHTVKGFLRADTKTQNESLAVQRTNGVINADEWRELEDLNPLPGGQGQIYIVQSGFVPLDSIQATADANLEKLKQPPPAPTPPLGAGPVDDPDDDAGDDVRTALRAELSAAQAEVGRLALLIAGADAREASLREQVGAVEARGVASAEEVGTLRAQLEAQALTVSALREAQREAAQQVASITADRDALEARVREVGEAHALAEIAVRHAETRAETAEADLALRAADLAAATERVAEAEREAQQVRDVTAAQIAAVEAAGGDQAAEIVRLAGTLQEASSALADTQRELQEARDAHAAAVRDVGAMGSEVAAAMARLEAVAVEAQAREAELQVAHQTAVEGLEANLRAQEDMLRTTAETATSLDEQVRDLQAEITAREAAARVASATLQTYEQRVTDLTAQVAQAEAQHEALRAASGAEAAALMAQIETLRAEHAEAADRLQQETSAAAETLRASHAATIAELETTYREALANLAVAIEERIAEEARVAALTTQLTEAQAAAQRTADEHAAALRAALEDVDDAVSRAALADDAVARAETLARSREAQAAEAVETRSQAVDRLIATIAAQRGVLVDAWGRMARRAVSQAKTKQATPDKLRRWLEAFPTLHEAICLEAVLPAVRLHLATCGKTDDPATVATTLVREHIASLQRVVRYALDAAPEDFHPEFDRLMARWEVDEPAAMADRLITEEIRDARR